jgi:site-specific recombinase XerD
MGRTSGRRLSSGLRVDDVDPKRMLLRIRGAKRERERYVMLSQEVKRRRPEA